MNRLVAFVTAMLISGCVTPLPPPKYQGTAAVTTQKTAEVSVVNGSVSVIRVGTLLPVGKIYVPVGGGKDDDVDTQSYFKMHRDFASNFCTELERLEIFRIAKLTPEPTAVGETGSDIGAPTSGSGPSVRITLGFVSTQFDQHRNVYTLEVTMKIDSGKPFSRQYHIKSDRNDNEWQKWNTNGAQAIHKTDAQLLDQLIPDVEAWAKENAAGS